MKEYIEREAVLEEIKEPYERVYGKCVYKPVEDVYRMIIKRINNSHAADVAPVIHGEWVVNAWDGKDWKIIPFIASQHTDPFCSCCKEPAMRGTRSGWYEVSDFCPHCGAKMDGGK